MFTMSKKILAAAVTALLFAACDEPQKPVARPTLTQKRTVTPPVVKPPPPATSRKSPSRRPPSSSAPSLRPS
jgi:hypothetical protein